MKARVLVGCFTAVVAAFSSAGRVSAAEQAKIEEVASFPDQQVTGVAVSKDNRVFVCFPFWNPNHTISVAEVMKDGTLKAFPDEQWNKNEGDPAKRWVCVQSVYVDDTGALWVIDPAAPMLESVVKGGPKLVKFDLASNQPTQTIAFTEAVAPERSYLNDVRIDTKTGHAYLTDSGLGALAVVDLKTGNGRRLLANQAATKAEPDVELTVDGLQPKDPKTGKTPRFNADGIALDSENGYLYWHPLTGHTLWRAKTEDLRNEQLSEEQLGAKIEKVSKTVAPDGMLAGRDGTIYLTAIEKDAIVRFDPKTHHEATVAQDKLLQWPDSLAWGADGWLYVTASQIHRMPKFNNGVDQRGGQPFRLLRIKLP